MRRGIGAARQDVNVSVAGGRRIEIKGVSQHRGLPRLVHNEAFRQLNLLRIRAELLRRGVSTADFDVPDGGAVTESPSLVIDASSLLRRSDYAPLCDALDAGGRAYAIRLPGFAGLLVHRTQPGITFASEFADRVRVISCLVGRPFMLHSDIEGYGLRAVEWKQLHNALGATGQDSVVVVFGPTRDCDTAAREVLLRAKDALVGVPAETRQAMRDSTTGFERILPGANRMYPDTDTPPMPIPDAWVQAIRVKRPERGFEREARYRSRGLNAAAARRLSRSAWTVLFDQLQTGDHAASIESILQHSFPGHLRRGNALPDSDRLQPWVQAITEGWLLPEAARPALKRILAEPGAASADVLARYRTPLDQDHLEKLGASLGGEVSKVHSTDEEARLRWAMGRTRGQWLGHHRASVVRDRIRQLLSTTGVTQ